jgi:outer membrane receptor for ferrienterochelin and colicins
MLVDGKRIAASDGVIGHSDFQNDWIAAEDIERIEVIRGPMSVLYGAEALGGVVNVITRPIGDRWAFSGLLESAMSESARGGDGHRAALRAAGPLGQQLRLGVSASDVQRDRVGAPNDARISDLEGRHKREASVLLNWLAGADQRVDLEHRVGREERNAGMRERSGARRFFESFSDVDRTHSAIGWHAGWGGAADARTLLRAYRSEVDNTNRRTNGVLALRPNRLRDTVAEGQASLVAARGHQVTGGFEWRDEQLFNGGLPGGQAQARHQSLYVQDEWALSPQLALTAGLRVDRHSQFGTETSPRIYAVWKLAPQWTLKGGFGHGFKAPTLKQISPDYVEDEGPFTYHGNAAVKPERNDALELGLGWETARLGVQVMAFNNRVDDLIVTRPTTVIGGRQHFIFDNEDSARLRGLEAATSAELGAGFKGSLNYVYLDATDGQGQRLEKRARHSAGLQLGYAAGPFSAGLRVEHVRGLVLASLVAGQPAQVVPAFTVSGLHLQWRLAERLDLGFAVDNLSDLRLADISPLFTYAEVPRTWRVSLRGRW